MRPESPTLQGMHGPCMQQCSGVIRQEWPRPCVSSSCDVLLCITGHQGRDAVCAMRQRQPCKHMCVVARRHSGASFTLPHEAVPLLDAGPFKTSSYTHYKVFLIHFREGLCLVTRCWRFGQNLLSGVKYWGAYTWAAGGGGPPAPWPPMDEPEEPCFCFCDLEIKSKRRGV